MPLGPKTAIVDVRPPEPSPATAVLICPGCTRWVLEQMTERIDQVNAERLRAATRRAMQ